MYSFIFLVAAFLLLLVGGLTAGYCATRNRFFGEPLAVGSAVFLFAAFVLGIAVYQRLEQMDEQRRLEQIRSVHR